ncbi:MAG: radical SAM protein [Nitrososphaeria archaeon]
MPLKAYFPGAIYPAISITGSKCLLNCSYCRGRYLDGMIGAETPELFYQVVKSLKQRSAKGILVSGGFDKDGVLPVKPFLPVIRRIKEELGLLVSVHSGLVNKEMACLLRESKVDIVDFQLVVDSIVIKELQGLKRGSLDYIRSLDVLMKYGPSYIAPHIPIGFRGDDATTEKEAVDLAKDYNPYLLTVLFFIPTSTPPIQPSIPKLEKLLNFLRYARSSKYETAIGCMRPPKMKRSLDVYAIEERLVDRVAVPDLVVAKKFNMKVIRACCSLPNEYLRFFS